MYLEILLLIIVIAAIGYLLFYLADTLFSPATIQNSGNQVCFGSHCFFVKLAKTTAEKEKGLMFVKQLDKNSGMLFIFDKEGAYPFWMKNTLIALDIIWIDSGGKVVFISQGAQPCKNIICPQINTSIKAKYVLEINAGISEEIGLKVGDELKLNILSDK